MPLKLFPINSVFISVYKKGGIHLEVSEKKLIKMCKDKKAEGFDLLTKKYEKYIYTICYYYTSSREDTLDLLQEIYIKLYRSIGQFDERYSILPWIKKITINTYLNFIRYKRDNMTSLSDIINDDGTTTLDLISSTSEIEDEISYKYTKNLIEDMIRLLPHEIRMAVILRHFDGMSYDEIATIMHCPIGTVKTHLFRGRKILKDKLKAEGIWEV